MREDLNRRGLSDVGHAPLVRHPEGQDLRAVDAAAPAVQRLGDELHDVRGHAPVDLVGPGDEAGPVAVQPHLPGQIAWIDGDAVTATAPPRGEPHDTPTP